MFKRLITYWRRHKLMRHFSYFTGLFVVWISLILGGIYAPERITYTDDQLATAREFQNKSGKIELTRQQYSEESGIVLLEFETTDNTSGISKGITATNLEWEVYTKNGTTVSMDIIPLTTNKIDVVIKDVPKGFEALAIQIFNNTVVDSEVDIDLEEYGEEKNIFSNKGKDTYLDENEEKARALKSTYFMITTQSKNLEREEIEDLSRERFTLALMQDERKFNQDQVKKMEKSIKTLEISIEEDYRTLEILNKEKQYLVGSNLDKKNEEITKINRNIESKKDKVAKASENIVLAKNNIEALDVAIESVKNGTYVFNAPISSVNSDL